MPSSLKTGLLALLIILAGLADSVLACPMCKLALENDDPQPRAYMVSILFMLGMISSVMLVMGGLLVWVNRAEKRAILDAGYDHLLENGVTE